MYKVFIFTGPSPKPKWNFSSVIYEVLTKINGPHYPIFVM